jgi:hypothetical protein
MNVKTDYLISQEVTGSRYMDNCRSCGGYVAVNPDHFCRICSEDIEECSGCGSVYSLALEYEDRNICPDCNIYYKYYIESKKIFNKLQYDIMSYYGKIRKESAIDDKATDIVKNLLQIVVNAKIKASIKGER